MSSKRNIRRRSCISKTDYETRKGARNAMYRFIRRKHPKGHYQIYKCRFGNHWHFGRNKRYV